MSSDNQVSTVAELLAAASGTVHSPLKEYPEGNDWASLEGSRRQWRMRESKEKLRDLAPDMARAGLALVDALKMRHSQCWGDSCAACEALATWAALGKENTQGAG